MHYQHISYLLFNMIVLTTTNVNKLCINNARNMFTPNILKPILGYKFSDFKAMNKQKQNT